MFNVLPEHLREEVFRCQAAHHMALLPAVHGFRRSQRVRLAAAAETCDLMPGEAVVKPGDLIATWREKSEREKT